MQNTALAEALPFGRFLDRLITSLRIWGREVFRGKDTEENLNLGVMKVGILSQKPTLAYSEAIHTSPKHRSPTSRS